MAKPIQYIQQYVPMDMSLAQNVLGMARQDMKERNQAFDQAAAFENSAIGQAYGVESWDTEYRNKVVEGIQSKINEALKRKGGDYASAGNDIAKIVMQERSNPFWNDNAKQMEAIKMYRELGRDADNMILGDPRMSYEDVMRLRAEGKDPFKVSALKKSEVYTKSKDYFSNFAKTLKNPDGTWKGFLFSKDPYTNKEMNQYYQNVLQYGFKDKADVDRFLATNEGKAAVNSLLSSYPELQGADKETISEIIRQGAMSGIGRPEVERVANQGFGKRPLTVKTTPTYAPSVYPNLTIKDKQDEINNNISLLREGLEGDSFNDKKIKEESTGPITEGMNAGKKAGYKIMDAGMDLNNYLSRKSVEIFGGDASKMSKNSTIFENPSEIQPSKVEKFQSMKNQYIKDYKDIYDQAKKDGIVVGIDDNGNQIVEKGDKAFVNWLEKKLIGDAVIAGTDIGFDDYDIISDVINKVPESRSANGDPNTLIPVEDFNKKGIRAKGISIASLGKLKANTNARMRPDGNIVLQLDVKGEGKKTEDYIVNPNSLGSNISVSSKNIENVQQVLEKYNYTNAEIEKVNRTPLYVGDRVFVVKINPKDHLQKRIVEVGQDKNGNNIALRTDVTIAELKYLNFLNEKEELNKGRDKKSKTESYSELEDQYE